MTSNQCVHSRVRSNDGLSDPPCPWCESDALRAEVERLHKANAELWGTLAELRIRYHAAGRRPEECYEMSLIDATLHGIVRGVADVAPAQRHDDSRWLVASGPDGYHTWIVSGVEAMERAYLEARFGPTRVSPREVEEMEGMLSRLRNDDHWDMIGGERIRHQIDHEDGWVYVMRLTAETPEQHKVDPMKVTDEMVNRFLWWKLPRDFAPDCGISFDGRKPDQWNPSREWPMGTNLFTAVQARAMLEHVLGGETPAEQKD